MRRVNNSRPTSFQRFVAAPFDAGRSMKQFVNDEWRNTERIRRCSCFLWYLPIIPCTHWYAIRNSVCIYIDTLYRGEWVCWEYRFDLLGYMFNIFHVLFVYGTSFFLSFPTVFLDIPPHSYNLRSTERDPHCIPHSIEYEFKFKYYYGTISGHRV